MNEPTAVQRYVTGDDGKARLRPVLISIMENFEREQAADMILGLVDVHQREALPLEEEPLHHAPTSARPPRRKRNRKRLAAAASGGSTAPEPPDPPPEPPPGARAPATEGFRGGPRLRPPPPLPTPDSGVRLLEPTEWYTLAEAGVYLGLKDQMIRNLIAKDPEALPRKTAATEDGGHPRTLLLGRGIIALRSKREKMAQASAARATNGHHHPRHDDDDRGDEGDDGTPRELGGDIGFGRGGFGPSEEYE